MKRIATLTLFVSLFVTTAALALDGARTRSLDDDRDHIYLNITQSKHWNMGMTMSLASFANLTPSQINAATMTPVTFTMHREAGTIAFEGTFRNGNGAGQFTFTPDRSYIDKVKSLGLDFELHRKHRETTEEEDLFTLALHDVSTSFIKSMQAIGFRTTLEKYLRMRIFNVTPEYVREMQSLFSEKLDDEEIVRSKIHGVSPQFVRDVRALGYNDLPFESLVRFRIHGVTKEFINAIRDRKS